MLKTYSFTLLTVWIWEEEADNVEDELFPLICNSIQGVGEPLLLQERSVIEITIFFLLPQKETKFHEEETIENKQRFLSYALTPIKL